MRSIPAAEATVDSVTPSLSIGRPLRLPPLVSWLVDWVPPPVRQISLLAGGRGSATVAEPWVAWAGILIDLAA